MPLDPHECRENAKRCLELASETIDSECTGNSSKHR